MILFLFCINADIEEMLQKNEGLWFNYLELFPYVILEKVFWFQLLILLYNLRKLHTYVLLSFSLLTPTSKFCITAFISSSEHEVLMVRYCGQSMSVVHCISFVVRLAMSTIALKAYTSYTPGPIDSIHGRKHWGDLKIKYS